MKKWSNIDSQSKPKNKKRNLKQILEENLVVESNLETDYVKIVGHKETLHLIENYYKHKQLKQNILFLSEAKNYFMQGRFEYIDSVIDGLEKELSKIHNE